MKTWTPRPPPPVRRGLIDPRSTGGPASGPGRPTLNDRRSTRG